MLQKNYKKTRRRKAGKKIVMESVGIRELKTHLSSYISKIRKGQRIIVTDRGKEVAELVPISKERRLVKKIVEKGLASWDGKKPVGLTGVTIQGKPLSDTVLKDRR